MLHGQDCRLEGCGAGLHRKPDTLFFGFLCGFKRASFQIFVRLIFRTNKQSNIGNMIYFDFKEK